MKHAVIYVFGLGDHRSKGQELAVKLWKLQGVKSSVFRMLWREPGSFEAKTRELLRRIDTLHAQGYMVSLVGTSAGASAVINIYAARQDVIHRVVCVCGKLRNGQTISSSTFARNQVFGESLQLLPLSLRALGPDKLRRILSIRPLADHLVPPSDTIIEGAQESVLPSRGHAVSIGLAITVFSPKIIGFIKQP